MAGMYELGTILTKLGFKLENTYKTDIFVTLK